jgi:thioesterase domain-containing protein
LLRKTEVSKPELLNRYIAPSTAIEKKLEKIWSKNLGIVSIGIHDNFFDLGGDSLMMTLVTARIKDEFNRTFTYRTILENPTIKQQAELLEKAESITDTEEDIATGQRWKYLKPVRTTGSKPALFAIPSGLLYQNVVRHLGDDQPFYCFDPLYDDDVKEAAEKCLHELIECQPEGPYFLAGYCLHGLVAYEMAQMLKARGQTIGLLIMFETFERATVIPKTSFWFYPRKLAIYAHRLRTISWGEKYQFIIKSVKNIFSPAQVDKSNARKKSYKPEIYTGDVVLFKSEEAEVVTIDAPYMGWKPYITGSLELYQTAGTHIGIMYGDKYAKIMSSKMKECLERAYRKYSLL